MQCSGYKGVSLEAMAELLPAGRGLPVCCRDTALTELAAWSAQRRGRVQLRAQLDRNLPSLAPRLPGVLGTMVGRLLATGFAYRSARRAGQQPVRPLRQHARRADPQAHGRQSSWPSQESVPMPDAVGGRTVLAADLALLADLDARI